MMKHTIKNTIKVIVVVVVIGGLFFYSRASGLFESRLAAPSTPAATNPVPDNWSLAQNKRRSEIANHLVKHEEDYDHFANFPVSKTDGIPLVILKLLPKVAPEVWGDEDNFLSVMGLFNDERLKGYPFPRGIGFTGLGRKDEFAEIDYASFTCGGCHIGRVRLPDGGYDYLDGGVNSAFNVIGYRWRIVQTLQKGYGSETDTEKRNQLVINAFLNALDKTHTDDPTYFYNNYTHQDNTYGARSFNVDYESKQVALFKPPAEKSITQFVEHQEKVYAGWKVIAKKFYPNIEERIALGFAGMEDAIGFNAAGAYQGLKESKLTSPFAFLGLPQSHGVTDIMVVWDQDSRNPRWNQDESRLVNGGGQWNGHIPLPIYKNIAAQITLGFENVDITVSAHAENLLDKLPPAIYPFNVDVALAKKGQILFEKNCVSCHQPNNGKVYRELGTDMGRALIAGTVITAAAQASFSSVSTCGPTTTVEMFGKQATPCATYRGVSMEGKSKDVMTAPKVHDGYNALPLTGLWAQAPYLHNGSVPTLYHMLIPNERPTVFMKSRLDYDQQKVGFSWDMAITLPTDKGEAYIYDTASSPSISNKGHDKDLTIDGVTYKLNWSDDKVSAKALIEYLKTL
jgi:hypothetical protein